MKKLILAIIVIAFTSCKYSVYSKNGKGGVVIIDKGISSKFRVKVEVEEGVYLYYETNDTVLVGDTICFKKK